MSVQGEACACAKGHVCKEMCECAKGGMCVCKGMCVSVQRDAHERGCMCMCKGMRVQGDACAKGCMAPAWLLARVYHLQVCTHRSVQTRVCREGCVGVGVHMGS